MAVQDAFQRLDACINNVDTEIAKLNGMVLTDEEIDARLAWMDASRARLAAMRSLAPKSHRDVQLGAMISLNSLVSSDYDDLPGDIPTLMREAFTREFGEEFPDKDSDARQATSEETVRTLLALDLHHRHQLCQQDSHVSLARPPAVHERRTRTGTGAPGRPAHAQPGRGVGVSAGWRGQP
ncbi:Paired amphipathic helix repeat [Carpediemonas membranifera]|uniref:Paired amphipathic helix repeat n=1 Tax=Carpediemonas membranifera TaxID=201153 RepID=A0A8J6AQ09_9EUKA|nr:Paired amphipathic helix repeat [Carpediemonas membranifera]|eukprot:KAG9390811.1 Paired amphipathic helix repeat [Carpediemonas membranifera]